MFRTLSTATLLGLLTISAVSAQNTFAIQANIPFDFTIANHAMNAGTYRLTYNLTSDVLTLQGVAARSAAAFVMARPSGGSSATGTGQLVFDCYGSACALAKVLPGPESGGRNLQVSEPARRERIAMQTRVVPVLIAEK